jgi:hypothetical protein
MITRSVKKWLRYTPWNRLGKEEVCSSYTFLTSALQGGEWSASRPGRALPPGKEPAVPTAYEAEGAQHEVYKSINN